ncbi:hypothetical protein [Ancylobacter sp. FA202]|uniref:hypothetical protein n=1 Tax=Ancylobacter sp. FA202 TaxID=1111106 RepID=UPI0003739461|nr:hypothetical protein [Ancylobacter sp. FA202]
MSYAEWPSGVPFRPERDMWGVKPVRDAAETQMEGGNVRLRRRPGDRLATMRWGRQLNPAEAAAFLAFIASIGEGTHRFLMPVCLDGSTYVIRLVQITGGLPEETTPGGGWLTVNLSLLVFPVEMLGPIPTIHVFDTLIMGEATSGATVDVEIDGVVRSAVATDGMFVIDGAGLIAGVHAVRVRYAGSNYGPLTFRTLASAFVGVLDALAASTFDIYSTSRLLTTWVLPVILARRSSDNATKAFYAISSAPWLVDPLGVSVAQWAGAGSAYIQTWYGQRGASRDATQATGSAQPRIVNAGVLDVGPNGRPVNIYNGSSTFLVVDNSTGFSRAVAALTMASVASVTNAAASPFLLGSSNETVNQRAALGFATGVARSLARRANADTTTVASRAIAAGWRRLIARQLYTAGTADISVDGATTSAAMIGTPGPSADIASAAGVAIGRPGSLTANFFSGGVSTVVLAQSSLDIAALDAALAQVMP